jgi:hypothetical protein
MDSSDSVCRILASGDARENAFCPSRCFPSQRLALPEADGLDIAGPNNPVFADVLHNLLKRRCRVTFQYVIT